ncbi:pyruvate kinase [Cuniculiplasma sp. SKW4]|uniref:pyruvate kinase n=1 Tax=Cuniculiplasma sp. SKW4 TaxID=3400171 RepID=UPI003FD33D4B
MQNDKALPNTKIVATFGPACKDEKVMLEMVKNGVSCFRLNTAHSTPEELDYLVSIREKFRKDYGKIVAIMVDLKGPELRAILKGDSLQLSEGKEYTVGEGEGTDIKIAVKGIVGILEPGDRVLFMDGKISTIVKESKDGICTIVCENSGLLRNRARMNVPGRYIPLGILQERDRMYLDLSIKNEVEFVALSFVQSRDEIDSVHDLIIEKKGDIKIIAKIETQQAMNNLSGIISASDSLMVARGDLGVEMPLHEVAISQKRIIKESHAYGVSTIVATQMLESMVENESATRAEISDVTNAIIDDADALMLSEETAIGKFPLEAVRTLKETALFVEKNSDPFPEPENFYGSRITYSMARAARVIASESRAHRIVAVTGTGNTARMVSSVRPGCEIIGVTSSKVTAGQINILRSVRPYLLRGDSKDRNSDQIISELIQSQVLTKGERIVFVSGNQKYLFSGTSRVSLLNAGIPVGRGYSEGKSYAGITGKNGIFIGTMDDLQDQSDWITNYEAFIIEGKIERKVLNKIKENGKTLIYSAILFDKPEEGTKLFIDSEIGSIYR